MTLNVKYMNFELEKDGHISDVTYQNIFDMN